MTFAYGNGSHKPEEKAAGGRTKYDAAPCHHGTWWLRPRFAAGGKAGAVALRGLVRQSIQTFVCRFLPVRARVRAGAMIRFVSAKSSGRI